MKNANRRDMVKIGLLSALGLSIPALSAKKAAADSGKPCGGGCSDTAQCKPGLVCCGNRCVPYQETGRCYAGNLNYCPGGRIVKFDTTPNAPGAALGYCCLPGTKPNEEGCKVRARYSTCP